MRTISVGRTIVVDDLLNKGHVGMLWRILDGDDVSEIAIWQPRQVVHAQ